MIKSQRRLSLVTSALLAVSMIGGCGGKTNPEADYSALIANSVQPSKARGPSDQYTCGAGFVIQVQGHGDASSLNFTSGTATSYTIEFVQPVTTPGMTLQLQGEGPRGSSFSAASDGTYRFTWTPPSAGQNTSGVSGTLRVSLKKTGDESTLDPVVRNCLDKSVTPVEFKLNVDGAGKVFDVSVQWPDASAVIQEGTTVPFNIVVNDETSGTNGRPHLSVGPLGNVGNEFNAENGSAFISCPDDSQATSQGTQWVYSCTFSAKQGATPKQASRHKTSQAVQGQVVIGYRISAQSADGKQKADFNDRRTVIPSAQPEAGKK